MPDRSARCLLVARQKGHFSLVARTVFCRSPRFDCVVSGSCARQLSNHLLPSCSALTKRDEMLLRPAVATLERAFTKVTVKIAARTCFAATFAQHQPPPHPYYRETLSLMVQHRSPRYKCVSTFSSIRFFLRHLGEVSRKSKCYCFIVYLHLSPSFSEVLPFLFRSLRTIFLFRRSLEPSYIPLKWSYPPFTLQDPSTGAGSFDSISGCSHDPSNLVLRFVEGGWRCEFRCFMVM